MKILFIHTRYLQSRGGEDSTLEAEAELLTRKGHEVRIQLFDNGDMGKGLPGKLQAGFSVIYNFSSAKTVTKTIDDFRPDLIHIHNFFFAASPSVLFATHKAGIPVVVTIHNFRLICANCLLLRDNKICELCITHDFPWYGVKYKCYHNSAVGSAAVGAMAAVHKWLGTWKNKVSLYITPSAFSKKRLVDSSFGVPAEKIKVKHNFIEDPGAANPEERLDYYLFVGRISAEKGIDLLLDAWTMVEVPLIIVGDGPDMQRIMNKYGQPANIRFVGKQSREAVLDLMKKCRALVFPSIWYEGLPLTIIEALATGTPVIASGQGAMSEMIEDGKNGLHFSTGDAVALTKAVSEFERQVGTGDHSYYAHARQSYLDQYHPEQCYNQIMEIYQHLVSSEKNG